jgi:hypothetical protein
MFQSTVFTTSSSLYSFFEKLYTSAEKTIFNPARCNMLQMLGGITFFVKNTDAISQKLQVGWVHF